MDPESEPENAAGQLEMPEDEMPVPEPEYFTENRTLDDLWRQIFPAVGTELMAMVRNSVYGQHKWNFSNLEAAFEEGGELHDKSVFLFGIAEPQLMLVEGEKAITTVPAVIAVVSPFPPSDKIGIISVLSDFEQIVPMTQMKMDWIPFTPRDQRLSQDETLGNSQIFTLSCLEMRDALGHLKIERIKECELCVPYFYNPFQEDDESTVVEGLYSNYPIPCFFEFDWEADDLEEFTRMMIEKEGLPADQEESFKEFLEEKVSVAKISNYEAREVRKKAQEEMSESRKATFQNMQFLKFYPVSTLDLVKSPFINRYYGKAHKVI